MKKAASVTKQNPGLMVKQREAIKNHFIDDLTGMRSYK